MSSSSTVTVVALVLVLVFTCPPFSFPLFAEVDAPLLDSEFKVIHNDFSIIGFSTGTSIPSGTNDLLEITLAAEPAGAVCLSKAIFTLATGSQVNPKILCTSVSGFVALSLQLVDEDTKNQFSVSMQSSTAISQYEFQVETETGEPISIVSTAGGQISGENAVWEKTMTVMNKTALYARIAMVRKPLASFSSRS